MHGHERAITKIRYNKDGDLLFSSAKDKSPNVWFSINGERLGTFEGHEGAVWSIDCSWDSLKVATGAADQSCRLWDCETGKEIAKFTTMTAVRTVNFSYSGKLLFYTTDQTMGKPYEMNVIDLSSGNQCVYKFVNQGQKTIEKPTASLWGPLDESLITGHDNGKVTRWDLRSPGEKVVDVQLHKAALSDMQYNKDQTMIVTASKDTTAQVGFI